MIVNNYYKAAAYFSSHHLNSNASAYGWDQINLGMVDTSGTAVGNLPIDCQNNSSYVEYVARNYSIKDDITIVVGQGDTEPTLNDYALEDDETANFTNYTVALSTSSNGGSISTVATVTGINNTGASITIREVGVVKKFYYGTTSIADTTYKNVLLLRHVLDEPKEIANGEGFSLTLEWAES